MKKNPKITSRALFWSGAIVFALGVTASLLYGHMDGQRLFFCSTVILGIAWVMERTSAD